MCMINLKRTYSCVLGCQGSWSKVIWSIYSKERAVSAFLVTSQVGCQLMWSSAKVLRCQRFCLWFWSAQVLLVCLPFRLSDANPCWAAIWMIPHVSTLLQNPTLNQGWTQVRCWLALVNEWIGVSIRNGNSVVPTFDKIRYYFIHPGGWEGGGGACSLYFFSRQYWTPPLSAVRKLLY